MATEKEYRLLDALAREEHLSKRQVARETGLSLGMVNIILRRLAKTGYIKNSALNGQTMRYVLTPKGSAELARRSYDYLLHVISTFGELREGITALANDLYRQGKRRFVIYGKSDVADIAELACGSAGFPDVHIEHSDDGPVNTDEDTAVLDCRVGPNHGDRVGIDVLEHLARARRPPNTMSSEAEEGTADERR